MKTLVGNIRGPKGDPGRDGADGAPGAPGGSDAETAQRVQNGPLTKAALSATFAQVLVYSGGVYPERPATAVSVKWVGPVEPPEMADDVDEWVEVP